MPKGQMLKSYNIIEKSKKGLGHFLIMSSIEMQPLIRHSPTIKHESPLERLRRVLIYYGLIADDS